MTQSESVLLLLCSGALNDIGEKSPQENRRQIKEVQEKIEKIAIKYLSAEDRKKLK